MDIKKYRVTIFLILGIALLSFTVWKQNRPSLNLKVLAEGNGTDIKPDVVAPSERIWLNQDEYQLELIHYNEYLSQPFDVVAHEGELFVSDLGEQVILRLDESGNKLGSIGEGRGMGPGEFLGFTDFEIVGEHLWVTDLNTRSISKFSIQGEFLEKEEVFKGAYKIANVDGELLIYQMGETAPLTYPLRSERSVFFGDELTGHADLLGVTGALTGTSSGDILFAPHYASYLYKLSGSGEVMQVIQTVDRLPYPESSATDAGQGRISMSAPKSEVMVMDVEEDRNGIYVNSMIRKAPIHNVIDKYSLSDGEYLWSIRLPFATNLFDVSSGMIYVVADTSLVKITTN